MGSAGSAERDSPGARGGPWTDRADFRAAELSAEVRAGENCSALQLALRWTVSIHYGRCDVGSVELHPNLSVDFGMRQGIIYHVSYTPAV